MDLRNTHPTPITDLLRAIRANGVELWTENGALRYRAPKGGLTPTQLESLRLHKTSLVELLQGAAAEELPELPSVRASPGTHSGGPFSFSQLWFWHLFKLENRCLRTIACATHLHGDLQLGCLEASLTAVVQRHDALRTRVVLNKDGVPAQEICDSPQYELASSDLTAVPEQLREAQAHRLMEQFVLTPIAFGSGPLFGAKLIKLDQDDYILLLAMDHMISDAFSLSILVKDLFTAYRQSVRGEAVSFPPLALQYSEYSAWQQRMQEPWIHKHAAYWSGRLAGHRQLRFPVERAIATSGESGLTRLAFTIDARTSDALRDWARLRRTTLALVVLTVYAAVVLRWCDASETIIQYKTSGRDREDRQNTIGYFASLLCLRIELNNEDRFGDLAGRVVQEYCSAARRSDLSYMALQAERLEFARNTIFNWIPKEARSDLPLASELEGTLLSRPVPLGNPALSHFNWDGDPELEIWEGEREITGHLYFTTDRFSVEAMRRLLGGFTGFINTMLMEPGVRVADLKPA